MVPGSRYGIELHRADGEPVPLSSLAESVKVDSDTGTVILDGYRGDSLSHKSGNLFLRFIVHRPVAVGADEVKKLISHGINVKTLTDTEPGILIFLNRLSDAGLLTKSTEHQVAYPTIIT